MGKLWTLGTENRIWGDYSIVKEELKKRLEDICQDRNVLQIPRLSKLFQVRLNDIQDVTTDYELLKFTAELSQSISLYLITHRYQAPKSVIDFGVWIASSSSKYRGKLSFLQMLALSLSGLFK